jgi:hypothetical protein
MNFLLLYSLINGRKEAIMAGSYSEMCNQGDTLYVIKWSSKQMGLTSRERRLGDGWLRRNGALCVYTRDSGAWWRVSMHCPDFVQEFQSNGNFWVSEYLEKMALFAPNEVPHDILNGKAERKW